METRLEPARRPVVPLADLQALLVVQAGAGAAAAPVDVVVVADLPEDVRAPARAQDTNAFEDEFWTGADLATLYQRRPGARPAALERIFEAGFREFAKHRKQGSALDRHGRLARARCARRTSARSTRSKRISRASPPSARCVPTSACFGTVWGIMNAFRGLSNVGQATLAHVAPGIAEALIATAIGLFAAIPAVVAYNRYTHDIDRLATRFETFIEEFSNILQRQAWAQCSPRASSLPAEGRGPRSACDAPQGDQPDQRRAVHRRDAGAAHHLHGHRAADQSRQDRPALGGQQAHRRRCSRSRSRSQRPHAVAARPGGEPPGGQMSRGTSSSHACGRSRRSRNRPS